MVEVDIKIPNQDRVHAVWSVAKRHGCVLGIGHTSSQDVAPDNEPLLPACHQLETEYMGTKGLMRLDLPMGGFA